MRFVDQIPVVDLILSDQYLFTSVMVLLFNTYLILYNDIVINFDLFAYDSSLNIVCLMVITHQIECMNSYIHVPVHVMYTINIVLF